MSSQRAAVGGARRTALAFVAGAMVASAICAVVVRSNSGVWGAQNATPREQPIVAIESSTGPTALVVSPRTPADAALHLYFAWQRSDRIGADRVASAAAGDALFFAPRTLAAQLAFHGCTKPQAEVATCSWKSRGETLTMRVSAPARGAARVQTVELR